MARATAEPESAERSFDVAVHAATGQPLRAADLRVLQVNVGLRCNLECGHCHVVSSPRRTEAMSWETMRQVLAAAATLRPELVDITGGAPELHPDFRRFVDALRGAGHRVQVRTNLTVFDEPGCGDLPQYFRDRRIELVASLPCYLEANVDRQRGDGVYRASVAALQRLNALGYGRQDDLPLYLVYNPGGPSLPPDQTALEANYRQRLREAWGIEFTGLYTLANMPLGRWRAELQREGRLEDYLQLLREAFNPATVDGLMCRHQIEVAWDGTLYDCDFHLAHRLPVQGVPQHISALAAGVHANRAIVTCDYCFGCTAGAGSSCGGALL